MNCQINNLHYIYQWKLQKRVMLDNLEDVFIYKCSWHLNEKFQIVQPRRIVNQAAIFDGKGLFEEIGNSSFQVDESILMGETQYFQN